MFKNYYPTRNVDEMQDGRPAHALDRPLLQVFAIRFKFSQYGERRQAAG